MDKTASKREQISLLDLPSGSRFDEVKAGYYEYMLTVSPNKSGKVPSYVRAIPSQALLAKHRELMVG